MRHLVALVCLVGACKPEEDKPALLPPAEQHLRPAAAATPAPKPAPWTFAVLSDLHLPNPKVATVRQTVAALIAMKVRFVVITGDHTNGAINDGRKALAGKWWHEVTAALQPLRDAGIPVLPVAGNHDSYAAWQRAGYAAAFADLDTWAKPLAVNTGGKHPFWYSVDVGGLHLALAHVVSQRMDPAVTTWLADDLAHATGARHRLVFGHVPMSSVIRPPNKPFANKLGKVLEDGKADYYIAGHEHVSWDENVTLPAGGTLRQVLVGCASGYYDYEPTASEKLRAACSPVKLPGQKDPLRCKMPNGGGEFVLARGRKGRRIEHYKNSFTVFTVDGDDIEVKPMSTDGNGHAIPFYLNE